LRAQVAPSEPFDKASACAALLQWGAGLLPARLGPLQCMVRLNACCVLPRAALCHRHR